MTLKFRCWLVDEERLSCHSFFFIYLNRIVLPMPLSTGMNIWPFSVHFGVPASIYGALLDGWRVGHLFRIEQHLLVTPSKRRSH